MTAPAKRDAAPAEAPFPIVGIGASAGGLEAFSDLLAHLPPDTGMGFVLVQHLDPLHESALVQLLARATTLPVQEAADKLRVRPNHVYVISPESNLVIAGGALGLRPRQQPPAPNRSVDVFFEALAQDQHERAIGVILSGTASDGTLGLEAIKAEGGITFAQDESARYDSMPRSAVAAGCVDFVLAPEAIAQELARIAHHPYVGGGALLGGAPEADHAATAQGGDAMPLPSGGHGAPHNDAARAHAGAEGAGRAGDEGFKKILILLRSHCGVDFSLYKSSTIQRRIARRVLLTRQDTLARYAGFLRGNAKELEALYSDALISVTSFFRNPEAFEVLQQRVLPRLLQRRSDEPLRVWVLGCSAGQEAYSIAMAFTEVAEQAPHARRLQVFATDLNDGLLDKARHGLYAANLVADLSPERLRRFFVEEAGGWRVAKPLREMVVFARQNVISDPPFSRMDMITCRNLLIYLEPSLQKKLFPVFHYALKAEGVLWLGASESIGGFTELFEPLDKKQKMYARKPASMQPFALPIGNGRGAADGQLRRAAALRPGSAGAQDGLRAELNAQREADRIVLSQFAPPGVLIDDALQILQFRGATGAYLEPPSGKASFDVLKMARNGLMLPLRAAIDRARQEHKAARKENVRVEHEDGVRRTHIEVIPLTNLRERCFLVLFEDADKAARGVAPAAAGSAAPADAPPAARARAPRAADARRIAELEADLGETREFVQSIQEQYEAANEELQAANEEVQSANEELQSLNEELTTSKEELESSNEELTTVNEEMANRNAELNRVSSDLVNVQTSAHLMILLLGRDLTLRRFSVQAERQFNLQASDIGRPIGHIRHPFDVPGLEALIGEVIARVSAEEREVQDTAGRWFSLQVRPYLTLDNKVDGAVLVLADITDRKRAQDAAAHLAAIVTSSDDAIISKDLDGVIRSWNKGAQSLFGYAAEEAIGKPVSLLIPADRQDEEPGILRRIRRGETVDHYETVRQRKDGRRLDISLTVSPIRDAAGRVIGAAKIARDISGRRAVEDALRASEERYRSLFDSIDEGFCVIEVLFDRDGKANDYLFKEVNPAFEKHSGLHDAVGKRMLELVPEAEAHWFENYGKVAVTGEPVRFANEFKTLGGRWFDVYAFRLGDAQTRSVAVLFTDITGRRKADEAVRESERRFREMIDTLPAAIYTTDAEGRLTHSNPAAAEFSGRTPELGSDRWCVSWKLFHADGTPMPHDECPMAVTLRTGRAVRGADGIVERPDGTRRWFRAYPTLLHDAEGRLAGGINMLVDITEAKLASDALRASEARYRSLFDAAPMAVFVCDREATIQYYNRRAVELWGREPVCGEEQHCGSTRLWLADGTALPHERSPIVEVLRSGEAAHGVEVFIERPDGSRLPVLVDFAAIRNAGGEVTGAITSFIDITERKQAEQVLRDADRRKNEFLAMLAHELRNPLAPLLNALQIFRRADETPGAAPAAAPDAAPGAHRFEPGQASAAAVQMMERQIGQIVRLVDDLLDVSRISRGKIDLRLERVELSSVLQQVEQAARPMCLGAGVELRLTPPARPVALNADPTRLIQIIGNLVNNACKFTDRGGRIVLEAEVDGAAAHDGGAAQAVIRVRDSGIGIAADQLPRVFEMFTQIDTSRGRSSGGLGIGLALVKDLVALHGGTVAVHSDGIGRGSEFEVRLPIAAQASAAPVLAPAEPAAKPATAALRVLVVDDNRDAAESLAFLLRFAGHETCLAHDGLEAVQAAAQFHPEVVLLDLGLPTLDGYEAARRIREHNGDKPLLLVALTGWGQEEDRRRSTQAGFDAHLVKPIEPDALLKMLAGRLPER